MPFRDLDAAWEADRFKSLRERLGRMREDARGSGQDYRILMPDSENPHNRLSNWGSWLRQYGRFLDGEPPGPAKDADRIRQYVLEHYIEQAREEECEQVEVLVRDVNTALGLNQAWPNICQALAGRKFLELAQVPPPVSVGADPSSTTVFRFDLRDQRVDSSLSTSYAIGFSLSAQISTALSIRERDGPRMRRTIRWRLPNGCGPRLKKVEPTRFLEKLFSRYSRPPRKADPS